MYKLVVIAVLLAPVLSIPQRGLPVAPGSESIARIVNQNQDIQPDGGYQYAYETENKIAAQEQGQVRQISPTEEAEAAQGSFQYISPEGIPIAVSYVADENGFQPSGAHLPTPPPIPEAIQRAIAYNVATEGGAQAQSFGSFKPPFRG